MQMSWGMLEALAEATKSEKEKKQIKLGQKSKQRWTRMSWGMTRGVG